MPKHKRSCVNKDKERHVGKPQSAATDTMGSRESGSTLDGRDKCSWPKKAAQATRRLSEVGRSAWIPVGNTSVRCRTSGSAPSNGSTTPRSRRPSSLRGFERHVLRWAENCPDAWRPACLIRTALERWSRGGSRAASEFGCRDRGHSECEQRQRRRLRDARNSRRIPSPLTRHDRKFAI